MVRETDPKEYDEIGREKVFVGGFSADAHLAECCELGEIKLSFFKLRPADYEEDEFVYDTNVNRDEEIIEEMAGCFSVSDLKSSGITLGDLEFWSP